MRVAVVGCGVIGTRRARVLPPGHVVTAAYDLLPERASALGGPVFPSLEALLDARVADVAIIATINASLVASAQACLDAGLDVLVEKPAARSFAELQRLKVPPGRRVKVGFNHRFHPAYRRLRELMRPDDPIMYVRARYGNGARVGFDREWRADVELAGGGELLDQGVHVIDLARGLVGDLEVRGAWVRTHFWDMPVDDNAWALCTTPAGQTFDMHVSSSEWKNEFQLDVYTRTRKLVWSGLGRSYGPEVLTVYRMKPEMGPPEVDVERFDGDDLSWAREWDNFTSPGPLDGDLSDALATLRVVDEIYRTSAALPHPRAHPAWYGQR